MHSASICIHSALMKYFHYALKVAIFQSFRAVRMQPFFFSSLNGVVDTLFDS